MASILAFLRTTLSLVLKGNRTYYLWMGFLLVLMALGATAYVHQFRSGLIVTSMRDPVSWGFYIGNFAFMVGVAAAAVTLVIPAYVYNWKPIKEVAILGEFLAISAVIMALCFVIVDLGHPDRFLHLAPVPVGRLNFPQSILSWDVMVLNGYLALNAVIAGHLVYKSFRGEHPNYGFVVPLILFSIPLAVSIHTVTAFLFNGLGSRPYWNASILAPRFLTSAFCSGPAILIIVFQIIRRSTTFDIKDAAIQKIAEFMAYSMFINLFLLGAEVYKEFSSRTEHMLYTQYVWFGIDGHNALVPYAWTSLLFSVVAFLLFLVPATRKNLTTLNIGCVLIFTGVYLEKGMLLILPGFTPSGLGEIYEYVPSFHELLVGAGIWGLGAFVFTLLVKTGAAYLREDVAPRAHTA